MTCLAAPARRLRGRVRRERRRACASACPRSTSPRASIPRSRRACARPSRGSRRDGCTVKKVQLPHTRHAVATYYVLATAEASSNLARFDGVRYGLRVEPERRAARRRGGAEERAPRDVRRDARRGLRRRGEAAHPARDVRALGRATTTRTTCKAQKVRTLIRRDFDAAFGEVDAIVCPTSPTPAFRLGEKTADPLSMYLSDVYTLPASLAGLPAISVPCAPTRDGAAGRAPDHRARAPRDDDVHAGVGVGGAARS